MDAGRSDPGAVPAEVDLTRGHRTLDIQGIGILTEAEIQRKLYGTYRGSGEKRLPSGPASAEWTGSEILSGELQRLRSELVSLRREREQLAAHMDQLTHPLSPQRRSFEWPAWWKKASVAILLLGAVGYLSGVRWIQASPVSTGELSPYTVQVAVYDVRGLAERTLLALRRLQYDAFLVEQPRRDGRTRYRLYVGSFITREEANLEQARLAGDPRFADFKDAFVRFR